MSKKLQYISIAILSLFLLTIQTVLLDFFLEHHILIRIKDKFGFGRPEITEYYKTMLTFHLRSDVFLPENSVLFIGDSLTQGLCVSCVAKDAVNYGIGKDTTFGVINRISKYDSVRKAKIIVLAVGINDVDRRNDDDIVIDFNEIINSIPKTTNILVSNILPVDERLCVIPEKNNVSIRDLNSKLMQLTTKYDNCFFLNITKDIVNEAGNLKTNYHIGDGVHLSRDGYKFWINALRKKLNEIEK